MVKAKINQRPNTMKNLNQKIKQLELGIEDDFLTPIQEDIINSGEDVDVKRMPRYLQVTQRKMKEQGVIDLKPYFSRSSKRKDKKDGSGWYLIIPIRVKTNKMQSSLYKKLNQLKPKQTYANSIVSYLEASNKSGKQYVNQTSNLNSNYKSGNITKVQKPESKKASYIMFRTVSNKSPSSSWIVGKNKVNEDNFSKTTLKHIDYLAKWRAKNLYK